MLLQESDGKTLSPNSRNPVLRRKGRVACKAANIRQMLLKFILGPAFHLHLQRKGMCATSIPSPYNYCYWSGFGIARRCWRACVAPLAVLHLFGKPCGGRLAAFARFAPRSPQSAIMSPTGATDGRGGIIICHEEKCVESGDRSRLHHLPFLFQSLDGRI